MTEDILRIHRKIARRAQFARCDAVDVRTAFSRDIHIRDVVVLARAARLAHPGGVFWCAYVAKRTWFTAWNRAARGLRRRRHDESFLIHTRQVLLGAI